MKHKMAACIIIPIIFCLILMSSCEKPEELQNSSMTEASKQSIKINQKTVNALSTVKFTDGRRSMSNRPGGIYLIVGDSFYILSEGGEIFRLNFATGCLSHLCADPLCDHKKYSCINNFVIDTAVVYNDTIYVKGGYMTETGVGGLFIGYYDDNLNQYKFLETWDEIVGQDVGSSIQVYDDYLYYLKKETETINNLWRINLNKNSKAECVSTNNKKFINGFIVKNGSVFYNYTTGESIYQVDLNFNNQNTFSLEMTPVFTLIDNCFIYSNYGYYNFYGINWDKGEKYTPSQYPYEAYRYKINENNAKETIASGIMGATGLYLDHEYITALPDKLTYIDKEIKNGETIYYINPNSACILVGNIYSGTMTEIDLSSELGINYQIVYIAYIDHDVCIVYFSHAYKENDKEGYYLIKNYSSETPLFYRLEYES